MKPMFLPLKNFYVCFLKDFVLVNKPDYSLESTFACSVLLFMHCPTPCSVVKPLMIPQCVCVFRPWSTLGVCVCLGHGVLWECVCVCVCVCVTSRLLGLLQETKSTPSSSKRNSLISKVYQIKLQSVCSLLSLNAGSAGSL